MDDFELEEMLQYSNMGNDIDGIRIGKDYYSFVEEMIKWIKARPLLLNAFVEVCRREEGRDFREILLENGIDKLPVIVHRLYMCGYYTSDEIFEVLDLYSQVEPCIYFMGLMPCGFMDEFSGDFNLMQLFELPKSVVDEYIQYGFRKGSIGYCLKYDDEEGLREIFNNPTFESYDIQDEWTAFEWSNRPLSYELVDVAAFFGSNKCLKLLITIGFEVTELTLKNAVLGGNSEGIQIINYQSSVSNMYQIAAKCMNSDIIEWILSKYHEEIDIHEWVFNLKYFILFFEEQNLLVTKADIITDIVFSAINDKCIGVIKYLAFKKVDLQFNKYRENLLHISCLSNSLSIVNYLILKGVDLSFRNFHVVFAFIFKLQFIIVRMCLLRNF